MQASNTRRFLDTWEDGNLWKDPTLLITASLGRLKGVINFGLLIEHYPENLKICMGDNSAHRLLRDMYIKIRKPLSLAKKSRLAEDQAYKEFKAIFSSVVCKAAEEIIKKKEYRLLVDWYKAVDDITIQFPELHFGLVGEVLIKTIHMLVGSEDKMLVGTRGGAVLQPIRWRSADGKIFGKKIETVGEARFIAEFHLVDIFMEYIDSSLLSLVPDAGNWQIEAIQGWPHVGVQEVEDKLLRALSDQRYTLPPSGAIVNFPNRHHGIENLRLVAKKSLNDDHGLDLVGLFTFITGRQFMVVLDSTQFVYEKDSPRNFFLPYIIASVFYNLVTPKYENIVRKKKLGDDDTGRSIEWKSDSGSRQLLKKPVVAFASKGHYRVGGNITPEQLEKVRLYEQNSGNSVIAKLQSGETFIPPFCTPAVESPEFAQLPLIVQASLLNEIKSIPVKYERRV